jgi:hypothetical protein
MRFLGAIPVRVVQPAAQRTVLVVTLVAALVVALVPLRLGPSGTVVVIFLGEIGSALQIARIEIPHDPPPK